MLSNLYRPRGFRKSSAASFLPHRADVGMLRRSNLIIFMQRAQGHNAPFSSFFFFALFLPDSGQWISRVLYYRCFFFFLRGDEGGFPGLRCGSSWISAIRKVWPRESAYAPAPNAYPQYYTRANVYERGMNRPDPNYNYNAKATGKIPTGSRKREATGKIQDGSRTLITRYECSREPFLDSFPSVEGLKRFPLSPPRRLAPTNPNALIYLTLLDVATLCGNLTPE